MLFLTFLNVNHVHAAPLAARPEQEVPFFKTPQSVFPSGSSHRNILEKSLLLKKALAEITGEVKEETALNEFIMAGFYEENKLFIDAITAYEKAIKLAPDVASYKEAYEEFLLRNKFKDAK